MAKAPAIKVNDVIKIGRIRISAPLTAASLTGTPDSTSIFTNSTINIDCRTMIPPSAIMPIIEVAVNSAPWNQCPLAIPIIVIGIGDMIRPANAKSRNSQTISPYISNMAAMNASPISRKVSKVTVHSPVHSKPETASLSGGPIRFIGMPSMMTPSGVV